MLELGVAVIYLWDMPHISYSWVFNNHDLSFSEMIKHINSGGYKLYVSEENNISQIEGELIPASTLQKYYGDFSDIVHGSFSTFESEIECRFSYDKSDWNAFVISAEDISQILLDAYILRFNVKAELRANMPALKK